MPEARSGSVLLPTCKAPEQKTRGGGSSHKTPTTSEVIYAAAVDLMYERAYHGTSVREVARASGIQMASVYYHFPSKQALLIEVMSRTLRDLTSVTTTAPGAAGGQSGGPSHSRSASPHHLPCSPA